MDYHIFFGALAAVIGIIAYIPYFYDIARKKTKPHAFSWLIWGTLTAIGFAAQLSGGAGPGAWVTGVTSVTCFIIFIIAVWRGSREFPVVDWIALGAAFGALALWYVTKTPLYSVILICFIDAIAFLPTYRKSYVDPHSETLISFVLSAIKFALAVAAMEHYSLITALYPASIVVTNTAFVLIVWTWRRRAAHHGKKKSIRQT